MLSYQQTCRRAGCTGTVHCCLLRTLTPVKTKTQLAPCPVRRSLFTDCCWWLQPKQNTNISQLLKIVEISGHYKYINRTNHKAVLDFIPTLAKSIPKILGRSFHHSRTIPSLSTFPRVQSVKSIPILVNINRFGWPHAKPAWQSILQSCPRP